MKMASIFEPENKKQYTITDINIYLGKSVEVQLGMRKSPAEAPWHSWHVPEKVSGTVWQGQQHPFYPLGLAMVAEPHLTDPKLLLALPEWGHHNSCSDRWSTGTHNHQWLSSSSSYTILKHHEQTTKKHL